MTDFWKLICLSPPEAQTGDAAAGGATGADTAGASPAATDAASAGSILYPEKTDDAAAGDGKPVQADGEKKPDGEPAKADGEKKEGDGKEAAAPELFDPAAIKVPEGMEVDQRLLDAMTPIFKDAKIDKETGQKLIDAYAKRVQDSQADFRTTVDGWLTEAKSDPEIGKAKWDENIHYAQKAVEKFGTPKLKEFLEYSGGGNHPEVIRAFARAGRLISDDKPVVGAIAAAEKLDAVDILYPSKG